MPDFEVFNRRARPVSKQPVITLQKRGTFSLNEAAFIALGEPEVVELLYDRTEKLVGMRKVGPDNAYAYPVRKQQNAASYLVAGNAFSQYYGIPVGVTRRWSARLMENVLVIDLKEPGQEVINHRARKQQQQ